MIKMLLFLIVGVVFATSVTAQIYPPYKGAEGPMILVKNADRERTIEVEIYEPKIYLRLPPTKISSAYLSARVPKSGGFLLRVDERPYIFPLSTAEGYWYAKKWVLVIFDSPKTGAWRCTLREYSAAIDGPIKEIISPIPGVYK